MVLRAARLIVAMENSLHDVQLATYRDKNRLLLVFAPSPQDGRYLEQTRLFHGLEEALDDRDLLVFYLFRTGGRLRDQNLEPETAETLRDEFNASPDAFTVVLVGKDGTEKERSQTPIDPAGLFTTIDQMPMRRRELRQQP